MSGLRVVVYPEGPAEEGESESLTLPTRPTHRLREDELGPAHAVVRRSIERVSDFPGDAVRFDAPLNLMRGRRHRGSDLLDEDRLGQLLTWPDPDEVPDLAVVLVDCDGERDKKRRLESVVEELNPRVERVVAMSIQEFEAWLIADVGAVNQVLDTSLNESENPETLEPGRAKELLVRWIRDESDLDDRRACRVGIAESMDLDRVAERCSAFEHFLDDLKRALSPEPRGT